MVACRLALAALPASIILGACYQVAMPDGAGTGGGPGTGDADADADADACAMNSGWPCTCDGSAMTCNDGSNCIDIQGLGNGPYCAASCTGGGGTCPPHPYAATGQCAVGDGYDSFWCILVCTGHDQCPPDQNCWDTGHDVSICLP